MERTRAGADRAEACPPLPSLDDKVAFLATGDGWAGPGARIETIETHMSWVFLSEELALKLKKPVRFPFLDFCSLEARRFYCEEEVRLNSRLAPGVYIGVWALQWHGRLSLRPVGAGDAGSGIVDWLVVMRRLPADRMLDRCLAAGLVTPAQIDALVAVLTTFYQEALVLPVRPDEYAARMHREQAANREVLLRPQFALHGAGHTLARMDHALERHGELLHERCSRARIVDGHGDLRPEHVCLLERPVVIDGLEFNPALRQVDPFDEIAFLGLECELLGAPWVGQRLLSGCAAALDDRPPRALMQLYTAMRALLRARLAMAHLLDPNPRTPSKWTPLAQRYIERASAALDLLEGYCVLDSSDAC